MFVLGSILGLSSSPRQSSQTLSLLIWLVPLATLQGIPLLPSPGVCVSPEDPHSGPQSCTPSDLAAMLASFLC